MKKTLTAFFSLPWYPLALGIYPILALFAQNITQVETAVLVRPLWIAVLCSCILLGLLRILFSNWHQAAFSTAAFILLFFLYGHVYNDVKTLNLWGIALGRHRLLLVVWGALALAALWVSFRKRSALANQVGTFNFVTVALLIFPLFTIVSHRLSVRQMDSPTVESVQKLAVSADQSLPDVYYIILDSYTRSDVLQEVYGYDNSKFLNELEQMGFYVAECSASNYMWTRLSMSSALNMGYLQENPAYLAASDHDLITEDLIKHSEVRRTFESLGYQTVAFATGFPFNEVTDADLFLEPPTSIESSRGFEALLVQTTLLRVLQDFGYIQTNQTAFAEFRDRTRFALGEFDDLATMGGPKFVYIHIITPHPPFVFGPNGEAVDPKDFVSTEGQYTTETYFDGYIDQVEFISTEISRSIQKLLNESPTPPIIILQGDHGPWKQEGENRFSILNAYYLPGHEDVIDPGISPVNSFRIIFNEYFDAQYPMLEDLSYESPYADVYDFTLLPTSCGNGK
jgi:hypothetical protein